MGLALLSSCGSTKTAQLEDPKKQANAIELFAKASRLLEKGDRKGALELFREIVSLGQQVEEYEEAHCQVGRLLAKLGHIDEAIAEFQRFLKVPRIIRGYQEWSAQWYIQTYQDPRPEVQREIALLYFRTGRYKEALETMFVAVKYYPRRRMCGNHVARLDWLDKQFIGECYEKQGELEKAIETYWDAIRDRRSQLYSDHKILVSLADIYVKRKQVKELKAMVELELKENPCSLVYMIPEYLEIVELKKRGDIAWLYAFGKELEERYMFCLHKDVLENGLWKAKVAAQMLGAMGNNALEFITERLSGEDGKWALYCARYIKDKRILKPLLDHCPASLEQSGGITFEYYCLTFLMLKEIAVPYLEEIVKNGEPNQAKAKELLEFISHRDLE